MTRKVYGSCLLSEGGSLELALCNKYENAIEDESLFVDVDVDGTFAVTLEVNEDDTCWAARNCEPPRIFWVYDGEGIQEVNLMEKVYRKNTLPALFATDEATLLSNVVSILDRSGKEQAITSEEEQRFMCRFLCREDEDEQMKEVDELIIKGMRNG